MLWFLSLFDLEILCVVLQCEAGDILVAASKKQDFYVVSDDKVEDL